MSETINWATLPDKDKIRLIITNVLHWPCYESSSEYHKRTDNRDGQNVAFWEDQPYGHSHWSVYYKPFNPLRRIEDAWRIIERFVEVVELTYTPGRDTTCKINTLLYGPVYGISTNPAEAICIAALRAVGCEVQL